MPRRDWRLRVADILGAIERIDRYTGGLDRDAFEHDDRTVEAVCFALVVIGEAASHVPEAVQAIAPQVPPDLPHSGGVDLGDQMNCPPL